MKPTTVRRRWVLPASLVVVVSVATALAARAQTSSTNAEPQIRAAHQQLLDASIKGDKEQVARYLSDDVTWTSYDGRVMDKQARLSSTPPPLKSSDIDQVRMAGNAAIVTGTTRFADGTEVRFLQEWINRDGQWKLTAHQGTKVAPATASGAMGTGTQPPTGTSGSNPTPGTEPRTVAPSLASTEERAVWKAQMDIVDAYAKGDVTRYSQLTSDDFARIETDGKRYTRSEWLDSIRKNSQQPLKTGAMSDVHIIVNGDVARVTLQVIGFRPDGSQGPAERQTRIFTNRNGQWQQAAAIATSISQ